MGHGAMLGDLGRGVQLGMLVSGMSLRIGIQFEMSLRVVEVCGDVAFG